MTVIPFPRPYVDYDPFDLSDFEDLGIVTARPAHHDTEYAPPTSRRASWKDVLSDVQEDARERCFDLWRISALHAFCQCHSTCGPVSRNACWATFAIASRVVVTDWFDAAQVSRFQMVLKARPWRRPTLGESDIAFLYRMVREEVSR